MGRTEIALEEFKALRSEIESHIQAQTTIVSVALTVTGVIAGVAFGAKAGEAQRLEILLALPLILSGLGLAYMTRSAGIIRIGIYVRERLWPVLQSAPSTTAESCMRLTSWEHAFSLSPFKSPGGLLTWLPGLVIFGGPSIAALAINYDLAWWPLHGHHKGESALDWAWFLDAVLAGGSLVLLIASGISRPKLQPDEGATCPRRADDDRSPEEPVE